MLAKSVKTDDFILQGVKNQLMEMILDQKKLISKNKVDLESSQAFEDDVPPSKSF